MRRSSGLALLVGGVGAYVLLPSATIVVTPRPEPITPVHLTVVADPNAAAPGGNPPVVPASRISIPVSVNDTFPATGKRVALTKATGSVRFENRDPTSTNRILSGSIVSTASGVRFRTLVTITVPRAELVGLTIFPARASVKVTAVDGGPDGNVDAGTIVIVPRGESSLFLKVTNPDPTTGGRSDEFTRVTQEDVDRCHGDPRLVAPGGVPRGDGGPGPGTQRDDRVPRDRRPRPVHADRTARDARRPGGTDRSPSGCRRPGPSSPPIRRRSPPSPRRPSRRRSTPAISWSPGSVQVEVGDAIIEGQTVSFPVTVTAQQIAILDPAALEKMVLGKPVDEAKAILAPYGEVQISVSPDWSGSIPSFESRVDLTIGQAVQIETPAPSVSATP